MIQTLQPTIIFIFLLFISACNLSDNHTELIEESEPISKEKEIWVEMLVEVPAGTVKKFELNKENGEIEMDSVDGKPRLIQYLGYPANYGMIPNTLLPIEKGGDGDPLDILSIGPAAKSGEIIKCKIIGVLKLLDRGEQDDKLIAISHNSTLRNINSLEDLRSNYPGILNIIEIWFTNYKGVGKTESHGYQTNFKAIEIINNAQLKEVKS